VAARFFRRAFEVPAGRTVRKARLMAGADNGFSAWINGRPAGSGTAWLDPKVVDVTASARPGRNALAIRAENAPGPEGHNPAGLIAGLDMELDDGTVLRVGTDSAWRSSRDQPDGWREPGFDDSAWPAAAELGANGIAPWGKFESRPPSPFPPLATGVPGGARVVYALDPRPLIVQGLTPNASYRLTDFDPVAGASSPSITLSADRDGRLRVAAPGHGHDRALSLVPAD
jgi:hypothetical protein